VISIAGTTDAFVFECSRLIKFPRIAWWAGLAAFPTVIMNFIRSLNGPPLHVYEGTDSAGLSLVLASGCATSLALILVATPVVYAELEGHTWTYLAVRPRGKGSVLVGKYLAAVVWASTAGWVGLAGCYWTMGMSELSTLWLSLFGLTFLWSLALGAVLVLIGVLALRRAMVSGVLYIMIFEAAISNIPAVVSKLTVTYHVRSLLAHVADVAPKAPWGPAGDGSPGAYIAALVTYAIVFLGLALYVLHRRQLVTAQDE